MKKIQPDEHISDLLVFSPEIIEGEEIDRNIT